MSNLLSVALLCAGPVSRSAITRSTQFAEAFELGEVRFIPRFQPRCECPWGRCAVSDANEAKSRRVIWVVSVAGSDSVGLARRVESRDTRMDGPDRSSDS